MSDLEITQIVPVQARVPLEGLYLGQDLQRLSKSLGRTIFLADFLTDQNGVIAKKDAQDRFQIPPEIRNTSDWRLFQELMAQADVIISGAAYFSRLAASPAGAQDILYQYETGGEFERLGSWRLAGGFPRKSPDLAIVARGLELEIPDQLILTGRKIMIFTSRPLAGSGRANEIRKMGVTVIAAGEEEVEGDFLADELSRDLGYRVAMMATGPGVLQLLLGAGRLDLLFITEAQVEIPSQNPSSVMTLLANGGKVRDLTEFTLVHEYLQENAVAADGSSLSQLFLEFRKQGMERRRD